MITSHNGINRARASSSTTSRREESDRGVAPNDARRMIDAHLDAGGNHFDIANVHAGGRAAEIVGAAVRERRDRVVLTTEAR